MDRYDEMLEAALERLRGLATERGELEKTEDEPEVTGQRLQWLEMTFGREWRFLTALLFDDPEQTEEQAKATDEAWFEYERKRGFKPSLTGWLLGDVAPQGPASQRDEFEQRRRAVRARVEKLNAVD